MSIMTSKVHSDVDIQQDVLEELSWDPHITVSDIGVSVKEGVVTLTGIVESYLVRLTAQNATLRVRGVHAVANEIEVRLHTAAERTDGDLALAALPGLGVAGLGVDHGGDEQDGVGAPELGIAQAGAHAFHALFDHGGVA